jgi:hypothetical protein
LPTVTNTGTTSSLKVVFFAESTMACRTLEHNNRQPWLHTLMRYEIVKYMVSYY